MANEKNTWFADDPVQLNLSGENASSSEVISTLVVYKNVIEDNNWKAEYFTDAEKTDVVNLAIGRTTIQVKDQNKLVFILTPVKALYEKEIYKPGKVELQMQVTDGDRTLYASKLRKLFLDREIKISLVTAEISATDTSSSEEDSDKSEGSKNPYISVAKQYYIYSLGLTNTPDKDTVVTLTCYSPDHKLTLGKSCQVYSGKKFADEIFKPGVKVSCPDISCDVNDLLFLSYDKNKVVGAVTKNPPQGENRDELLQPYLMQFNESFYNFICRTAHRCGEFLYYEDGKLCLGLPESTRKAMDQNPQGLPVLTPYSVTYPELVKEAKEVIPDASDADKKEDEDKTPKYRNDRDLQKFTKNDIPEIEPFRNSRLLLESFSEFAQGTSAIMALAMFGTKLTFGTLLTRNNFPLGGQRHKQLGIYEDYLDKVPLNADKKATSTILQDILDNLCEDFYQEVAAFENKATAARITMDFDDIMPDARLAEAVTLNDDISKAYIITSMKGEFSLDEQHHTLEALPRLEKNKDFKLTRKTGKCQAYWFPPTGAETTEYPSTINSMEAIVTDNLDPFRLGRVRVKYLWQTKEVSQESTGWIDVITPFAGEDGRTGGIFMMPAIGAHVMVNFVEEKANGAGQAMTQSKYPYVVGSLFTKTKEAPGYEWEYDNDSPTSKAYLPNHEVRTIQSKCGHGITFMDSSDTHFLIDSLCPPVAQIFNAANNGSDKDSLSALASCGGGMILHDSSGFYSIEMNSGKRTVDISSPLGTVSLNAFTGITISAPNGDINIEGKNINLTAGNNISIKTGVNVDMSDDWEPFLKAGATAVLAMGGKLLSDTIAEYTGISIASAVDFSFLKASWETIMRPVEATLSISSTRNIAMTAGFGKAVIPAHLMAKQDEQKEAVAHQSLVLMKKMMAGARKATDAFYDSEIKFWGEMATRLTEISKTKDTTIGYMEVFVDYKVSGASDIVSIMKGADGKCKNAKAIYESLPDKPINRIEAKTVNDALKQNQPKDMGILINVLYYTDDINNVIDAVNECIKLKDGHKDLTKLLIWAVSPGLNKYCDLWDKPKTIAVRPKTTLKPVVVEGDEKATSFFDNSGNLRPLKVNVKNRHEVLTEIYTSIIQQLDNYLKLKPSDVAGAPADVKSVTPDKFFEWVDRLDIKTEEDNKSMLSKVGGVVKDAFKQVTHYDSIGGIVNWNGCSGPRAWSDVTTGGSILMSNNAGVTYTMKEDGTSFEQKANPTVEPLVDFLKRTVVDPPVVGQAQKAITLEDIQKQLKQLGDK